MSFNVVFDRHPIDPSIVLSYPRYATTCYWRVVSLAIEVWADSSLEIKWTSCQTCWDVIKSVLLEFLRIDGPGSFWAAPDVLEGCTIIGWPFTRTMVSLTELYPPGGPGDGVWVSVLDGVEGFLLAGPQSEVGCKSILARHHTFFPLLFFVLPLPGLWYDGLLSRSSSSSS